MKTLPKIQKMDSDEAEGVVLGRLKNHGSVTADTMSQIYAQLELQHIMSVTDFRSVVWHLANTRRLIKYSRPAPVDRRMDEERPITLSVL